MKLKTKVICTVILILLSIIIHLFCANEMRVEKLYATGFFSVFSKILRFAFGFLAFSIGDILYGAAVVFILVKMVQFFRFLLKRPFQSKCLLFHWSKQWRF